MGHRSSRHTAAAHEFGSRVTAWPPQQRSVTPPPAQVTEDDSQSTNTAVLRRRRAESLQARNTAFNFRLPPDAAAASKSMRVVGHLNIDGQSVCCSNDTVRRIVWNSNEDKVDSDVSEALQILCGATLRGQKGGYHMLLQRGPVSYHFVTSLCPKVSPTTVQVSVRVPNEDGTYV